MNGKLNMSRRSNGHEHEALVFALPLLTAEKDGETASKQIGGSNLGVAPKFVTWGRRSGLAVILVRCPRNGLSEMPCDIRPLR
jgi:hypothetical protein